MLDKAKRDLAERGGKPLRKLDGQATACGCAPSLHPIARRAVALAVVTILAALPARGAETAPAAQTLSLNQAVAYALQHSPDLQAAAAEVEKEKGNVTSARSALLPNVNTYADASRYRYDQGVLPGVDPRFLHFGNGIYTTAADLHWLAYDFQSTAAQLHAVHERLAAAHLLQDRRRQQVIYLVTESYLKALTYQDLIQAASATEGSLQSLLAQTRSLVKAGRAVPLDELKVQTRLAQVQSDREGLEAGRQATMSRLLELMGWEQQETPELAGASEPATSASAIEPYAALVAQAQTQRPDVAAAGHQLDAARAAQKSAQRSKLPKFDFHAGLFDYGSSSPLGFFNVINLVLPQLRVPGGPVNHWQGNWVVGGRVTFPLFDGGFRKGQVAAAAGQVHAAQAALLQSRLAVAREIRTSLANLQRDQQQIQSVHQSVEQAQEAVRLERLKFQAGRSTIEFVLQAEAALLTNQSLLAQAQRTLLIDQQALALSVGSL